MSKNWVAVPSLDGKLHSLLAHDANTGYAYLECGATVTFTTYWHPLIRSGIPGYHNALNLYCLGCLGIARHARPLPQTAVVAPGLKPTLPSPKPSGGWRDQPPLL